MKYAELWLPYFKQGDDLYGCLDNTDSISEALDCHVSKMEAAKEQLLALKEAIAGREDELEIDAGTHHIGISGPDDLIDELIESEVLRRDPFDREE